jgi:hypothetical protein
VAIKVFNVENIGILVDSILKKQGLTIKGFEWLPLEVLQFNKLGKRSRGRSNQ